MYCEPVNEPVDFASDISNDWNLASCSLCLVKAEEATRPIYPSVFLRP